MVSFHYPVGHIRFRAHGPPRRRSEIFHRILSDFIGRQNPEHKKIFRAEIYLANAFATQLWQDRKKGKHFGRVKNRIEPGKRFNTEWSHEKRTHLLNERISTEKKVDHELDLNFI